MTGARWGRTIAELAARFDLPFLDRLRRGAFRAFPGTWIAAALMLALAAPASAQPVSAAPIVIGETWRLPSQALAAERTINVWTPPGYEDSEKNYPVLFVIDGGLAQDFHHISGLAQLGAISWLTREFVVVGIETVDRRRELAFPVEREAALRAQYPTAGESEAFRRFVVEEVKPFVAARYRTSSEVAVIGESLAGLFIIETLLKEPDAFDTYIAMDPSLWWDEGRLAEEAPALLSRNSTEARRLWLSVGAETLEQPAHEQRLLAALNAQPEHRLQIHYEPRPGLNHATIYHPTAWEALQALYPRAIE